MIKLLLAVSAFEIGGISAVAKNLMDSLDRDKFKLVLLAENIEDKHFDIAGDVKVIDLGIKPQRFIFSKIVNIIKHIITFRKKVISENPDLIFSLAYTTSCYLLFKPIKNFENKIIVGEYSEAFFVRALNRRIKYIIYRFIYKILISFTYRKATKVVVISNSISRILEQFCGLETSKIKVIPPLVNIKEIKLQSEEENSDYIFNKEFIYISFLSRLSREKGITYLLEAFARLKDRIKCKLIIIGDGAQRKELENLAQRLHIKEDVNFLGYRKNPFKYIKQTDMFVLPSVYEGFPTVILESYACGTPVIATRCVAGIEELIADGKDGILVNPADSESLFLAMYNLAVDKELRERLRQRGLEKVEEFDISTRSKEYQDLFWESIKSNN